MSALNLGLAFLEGLVLIASPCILPILPIVLSAGLDSGKLRPFGVIAGFIFAFWEFTLFSRTLISALNIDPTVLRQVSYGVLLLFGLILCSEFLSAKFDAAMQGFAQAGQGFTRSTDKKAGFISGFILGIFIGLIWSPCVGPIIAVVLVQTIRQKSDWHSALLLASFSLGVGLPMLLITLGGKTIMRKLAFLKANSIFIRKALGAVIIGTVLLTAGHEFFGLPLPTASAEVKSTPNLVKGLSNSYPASDFKGISAWINSKPLSIQSLKGKVVLVDFWTYSCVNCVRTLPYITSWDKKYRNKGLVIVGVHSPEFEFEKKLSNVQMAVTKFGIHYPVALDNNLDTFSAFNNQYWPAHYLINRDGKVVYTHFGEGEYDVTENNIRRLLGLKDNVKASKSEANGGLYSLTPETYLGYARARNFKSPGGVRLGKTADFTFPETMPMNGWSLSGKWNMDAEQITAMEKGARLRLRFTAKKVFLVLGSNTGKPVNVSLWLNGKLLDKNAGKDIKDNRLLVKQHRLYELINQSNSDAGWLELRSDDPGLSAYAFTFGS